MISLNSRFLNTTNNVEVFISEIDDKSVRISKGTEKHHSDDFQPISNFKRLVSLGAYKAI